MIGAPSSIRAASIRARSVAEMTFTAADVGPLAGTRGEDGATEPECIASLRRVLATFTARDIFTNHFRSR
jgi:hypothetical protein